MYITKELAIYNDGRNNHDTGGDHLICPVCKHDNIHFLPPISEGGYQPGSSSESITINMYCELGHTWRVVFSHHEGTSHLKTTIIKNTSRHWTEFDK